MKNIFVDTYQARKTLREIKILRKLSRIPNNLFTTQLIDVILPEIETKKEDVEMRIPNEIAEPAHQSTAISYN